MGIFTTQCANPECGQRISKGAKFCRYCGGGAPGGTTKCRSCGSEVALSSKFCWSCGGDLGDSIKPVLKDDKWDRQPGDFAIRIDDEDVRGKWVKPLVIEHGCRAMYFKGGKYKGELSAGKYNADGLLTRLPFLSSPKNISVVLIDATEITVEVENAGMWTSDRIQVGTQARLFLKVADPEKMYLNLFKTSRRMTVDAIEQQIAAEAQNAMEQAILGFTADQLFTDANARPQLEAKIGELLKPVLDRIGFEMTRVRFIDFHGEVYERIREQKGQIREAEGELEVDQEKLKLERMRIEQRARWVEAEEERLRRQGQAQDSADWQRLRNERDELDRDKEKLRIQEDRIREDVRHDGVRVDAKADRLQLSQKLRDAFTQEKFHEIKSKADVQDYIKQTEHELGMKGVIREDEIEKLTARLEFERDRDEILRRFEIIGITNDQERQEAWARVQHEERVKDEYLLRDLERELMGAKNDVEKQKLEADKARIQSRLRLEVMGDQKSFDREQRRADSTVQQELDQAQHSQKIDFARQDHSLRHDVRRDEHDQRVREAKDEFDLRRDEQDDTLDRKLRAAKEGNEILARTKDIEIDEKSREAEIDVTRADGMADVEAKQLEARSKATAEALISIVDGPQAGGRLAEIEELRIKSNLAPEQILALTAEASPQAAQALMEKYVNDGTVAAQNEAIQQLQARLTDQQAQRQEMQQVNEKRVHEQQQMAERAGDRVERLMSMALNQMGNVASTRAEGTSETHHHQTVVSQDGRSGPVMVGGGGDVTIVACAGCNHRNPQGAKFCENCGKKLG